ncbi:diaminopimelate decarboxylase [Streptomyces demainii]|uniref:Diaminopimelate decarboxylase n=1 Tax=Streptomyces demainii TaxID=588122 RepID=A0ABT9L6W4_9ACTN|nr:diaminopimelate decarboxylase [Streptomyces demainii]MDP9616457.1 diaminopimelate decarboxylase [Streptomyces demainii]
MTNEEDEETMTETTVPVELGKLHPELWPRTAEREADGVLRIGRLAVTELAERFGTPAYLFDEDDFRVRCAEFAAAFHDVDVYYAGKAFLCRAVARMVAEAGLSLDVCTGGELKVALAAGFPTERIVMHGNNKTDEELAHAVAAGVGRYVVDSFDEIDRLTVLGRRYGTRPRALVRVSVGVKADTHTHISTAHDDQKFGFPLADGDAAEAVRRVLRDGVLDLRGLHMHIGSQIFGIDGFEAGARRLLGLHAAVAADHGVELPELSLGGGFAIAYVSSHSPLNAQELADRLRAIVADECAALGVARPRLAIEPGRSLVGTSGVTLYRVGTVKPLAGRRTYVSVDGGMSDNIRPALYDGVYSVVLAGRHSDAEPMLSRVVGRHCDAGDIVVRDDHLPGDVRIGDLLAVPGTGAYCRSLSNNFNHVPRPPVVAVSRGEARLIIRRETDEDMLRLDMG